jgi:hypothetical protein
MIWYLNLFASDTQMLELCDVVWMKFMYAWVLIVCVFISFPGDRIKRRLCGGGWSVWVPGGRWSGTSQPRQAIYLLHIWISLSHYALFHSYFYFYVLFLLHCYSPYIAIVGGLAPQANWLSSIKDDTLWYLLKYLKVETRWLASKSLENL